MNRTQLAKALNEFHQIDNITPGIIRDVEEDLTSRWLPHYIEYAVAKWGVTKEWIESDDDVAPIIKSSVVRESTAPYELQANYLPVRAWQGAPIDHDVEFRPINKFINSEINLPNPPNEYCALEVFGSNIAGRFNHGSIIIIRLADIPPNNSIALVENSNQAAVLRGFLLSDKGDLELYPLNVSQGIKPETKHPGQKFVGYVVAVIERYDPRLHINPNILYNRGEPLIFRHIY